TGTRRTEQQNITLLQFYVVNLALDINALVVIIYRNRQRFLRLFLANDILIQDVANFLRLRNFFQIEFLFVSEFLFYNLRAQFDALVTYINARSGNKLADLLLRFAAERAF